MKLNETDLTKIRLPLAIMRADDGSLVTGYAPGAHELQTSQSGAAWSDAAGSLVEIGGGAYYYQGTLGDATVEGFLAVYINNATYRAMAWRPVVGSAGLTIFPFSMFIGGVLAAGAVPFATLQMSLDGASFVTASGSSGEMGGGYYYYRHDVANVDTPVIIKATKATYDEALAWGDAETGGGPSSGGGIPLFEQAGASTSSTTTDEVGDLLLEWSNATGDADLAFVGAPGQVFSDLASDRSLVTAILLSLFTDRRAETDDVPPSGDPSDRRGWWADQFAAVQGDKFGSRLWLLERAKPVRETELRAKEYATEALAWLIEDKVAKSVDVAATLNGQELLIGGVLTRSGRDPVPFLFSRVWDRLQEDI